jgi:hypothetical protein
MATMKLTRFRLAIAFLIGAGPSIGIGIGMKKA